MGQAGVMGTTIAGQAIGSYFGGPIGSAIGGWAGGVIGGLLFGKSKKPLIADTQLANSTYGNPLPILYGTGRLPGIMIWATQVQTKPTGLFKGGFNKYPYSFHQSAALAFCEGPAHFVKIWLDGKLFWDSTAQFPGEMTKHTFAVRTYPGTASQLPDYLIAEWVRTYVDTPAACPAYRDTCYMVFDGIDLAYYGSRFPQVTVSWSANAEITTFFTAATPLVTDVSAASAVNNEFAAGAGTDFVRGLIYTTAAGDGSIRSFNVADGSPAAAATVAQIFDHSPVLALSGGAAPTVPFGWSGISCGQGTNVYLWIGSNGGTPANTIYALDPNTLALLQVITLPSSLGASLDSLCVWSTQGAGNGDMLIGSTFEGTVPGFVVAPAFYADPVTVPSQIDLWYGEIPASLGVGGYSKFAIGDPDPDTSQTTIYMTNAPFEQFGGTSTITLSSFSVLGPIISVLTGPVQLGAATFGLAVPGSDWAMYGFPGFLLDPIDGNLIFFGVPWAGVSEGDDTMMTAKLDSGSQAIIWTQPATGAFVNPVNGQFQNVDISAGTFAAFEFASVGGVYGVPILDTQSGLMSVSPIATADAARSGLQNQAYDSSSGLVVYNEGEAGFSWIAKLNGVTTSEVTVASILTDLCSRVGVTPDMIDVSAVTATTVGYVVRDNRSCGAALADLCHVYMLDMVESDYLLKFVPRSQPVVATIMQGQLGSLDASDPSQYWPATPAQEQEMPLEVALKYSDPDLDFQPGSAYARRTALTNIPTIYSKRKMRADLPVIVDNAAAQVIAYNWLYTTWASRVTYQSQLSHEFLWLDPTDNVVVVMDNGDSYTVRIERIETGADLVLKLNLADEDLTVLATPPAVTPVVYGNGAQVLAAPGYAELLQFNTPLLQDADAVGAGLSRIYYAAGASSSAWTGGLVYLSANGVSFNQIGQLPSGANWGSAVTALSDWPAKFATDHVNSVRVRMSKSAALPSSCAYLDLMNGANGALLGPEVIQFQTVTDNADGTITLSDLVRGRRGTDWATGLHGANELFLLLQPGLVSGNSITTGEIGVTEQWQLAPFNAPATQSNTESFAYLGYDLMPYAPVAFSRTPSGSDLVLAWLRRTRIGGLQMDGTDVVPLNEDTEAYDAYLLPSAAALAAFDPASPATYTRAFITLTAPAVTYTSAMMTADGFTPATQTLYLVVYQLSGVVGRGFQGYQALPAF